MYSRRELFVLLFCLVLISCSAFADDPPGRVARLNYINGQVSVQPNGVNEWVAAAINRPLTTSDRVWTDQDARAELQLGAASVRLNSETSLTLANVSDNAVQLQLDQGTLNLHVVRLYKGEIYEIDTPNLAFTVEKSGDYRFDVDNAGDTTVVTVWKGRGEATGDNPGVRITSGEQVTFRGGRSLQYVMTNAPGFDGFDSWCQVRAEREDRSPSLRYVSPYAVGYSDLDDYGRWETIAPYGPVWIPANVAYGWAPYRWGHWVFIAPWGWTWVDDAPWGFAPYHYGRWVDFGPYWGWCPGPVWARPVYAPALVAWIGGGRWGVGLSFGIGGGVGWFPLGWGEPYIPYYGHSRNYFRNVNITNTHITNITYITNNYYGGHNVNNIHYVNHVPVAVTAVSNTTFVGSRPTRSGLVRVSAQTLKTAAVVDAVPMRPTRDSHVGPVRPMAAPPATAFSRPVVTKMSPPIHSAPPVAGVARPGRPAPAATTNPPVASDVQGRPSRSIPRPPQSMGPVRTADETPRGVAIPNNNAGSVTSPVNTMPSRVPRPMPGTAMGRPVNTQPTAMPNRTIPNSVMTNGASGPPAEVGPSRVPRPAPGSTYSPATSQPVYSDRPTREVPRPSNVPAPNVTPAPNGTPAPSPNVNRIERPVVRPQVVPAPVTSTPSVSAPAPRPTQTVPSPQVSQPARESRPQPKLDRDNAGPRSDVRYPTPYNGSAQPTASYVRNVPRPAGPVAPAPQSYSSAGSSSSYSSRASSYARTPAYSGNQNVSASRVSSAPSRPSYSQAARAAAPSSATRSAPPAQTGSSRPASATRR